VWSKWWKDVEGFDHSDYGVQHRRSSIPRRLDHNYVPTLRRLSRFLGRWWRLGQREQKRLTLTAPFFFPAS